MSNIHQYFNLEINEAIEKFYLNLNINSQEQKEKGVLEIQKIFLEKLSKNLEKSNTLEISDLIIDKSIKISEITNNYDWPSVETLKVPNIFRNTNYLYNYIRARLNLLSGKGKKHFKDAELKGFESIINILNCLIEDSINLENELIYLLFEDLFSFYSIMNSNEKHEKSKELIEELVSIYKEETNISGLAKMEKIDKNAENNFFRGTLVTFLQFKLDLFEENKEMEFNDMENIFKHEKVLRNICFLCDVNFVWALACYKFIKENDNEKEYELSKKCLELFDIAKNYEQFLIPNKNNIINIVRKHIEKLTSLLVIYFVNNNIYLNKSFFCKLAYKPEQISELKGLSRNNLSPLRKILSKVQEGNKIFKYEKLVLKKLEDNSGNVVKGELREKFNELIIYKDIKIEEKDVKNNEDYLKKRLIDDNKKYVDLMNF